MPKLYKALYWEYFILPIASSSWEFFALWRTADQPSYFIKPTNLLSIRDGNKANTHEVWRVNILG